MEITINEKNITLKNTMRSYIIFESITNKTFSPRTVTDLITYFYSVVLASDTDLQLQYDDFIDWLDNNPAVLNDFSEWINQINDINSQYNKQGTKKKTTKKTKS